MTSFTVHAEPGQQVGHVLPISPVKEEAALPDPPASASPDCLMQLPEAEARLNCSFGQTEPDMLVAGVPCSQGSLPAQFLPSSDSNLQVDKRAMVERKAWNNLRLALDNAGYSGSLDTWKVDVRERKAGMSKGELDVYFIDTASKKRCRSLKEVVSVITSCSGQLKGFDSHQYYPQPVMPVYPVALAPFLDAAGQIPMQIQHHVHQPDLVMFGLEPESMTQPGPLLLAAASAGCGAEHTERLHSEANPAIPQWPAPAAKKAIKIRLKVKDTAPLPPSLRQELPSSTLMEGVEGTAPPPAPDVLLPLPAPVRDPSPPCEALDQVQGSDQLRSDVLREQATLGTASPPSMPPQEGPCVPVPASTCLPEPPTAEAPSAQAPSSSDPANSLGGIRRPLSIKAQPTAGTGRAKKGINTWRFGTKPLTTVQPTFKPVAAPHVTRVVLKKVKAATKRPNSVQGGLDLLIEAALADEASQQTSCRERPTGATVAAPASSDQSDPGSGSATDVAPALEPALQPLFEGTVSGNQMAALQQVEQSPDVRRGVRASYRKRRHGQLPDLPPVSKAPSQQQAEAATPDASDQDMSPVKQAAHLLQEALPSLQGVLQVVKALQSQGIGGAKFDAMDLAISNIQAAHAFLKLQ